MSILYICWNGGSVKQLTLLGSWSPPWHDIKQPRGSHHPRCVSKPPLALTHHDGTTLFDSDQSNSVTATAFKVRVFFLFRGVSGTKGVGFAAVETQWSWDGLWGFQKERVEKHTKTKTWVLDGFAVRVLRMLGRLGQESLAHHCVWMICCWTCNTFLWGGDTRQILSNLERHRRVPICF